MQLDPVAIAAVHNRAPPRLVGDIPVDGFEKTRIEGFRRAIPRLERCLHGIDRVTPVVAGAILYEFDQLRRVSSACRRTLGESLADSGVAREDLVDVRTDRLHDVDVPALRVPAEIIRFADAPLLQHSLDTAAMIAHVEPVADLQPISIDRYLFSIERVYNRQRNQLLRKMLWPGVGRGVGCRYRQAVGVMVRANQVIRGGLARRVR